jgi:serine/threonine protein kinase
MAPEVMMAGKVSRASDVYAYGVLLWELYTAQHAFKGVPRALLGHEVARNHRRPEFPAHCPFAYQMLACRCWESNSTIRPSFAEILGGRLAAAVLVV